MCRIEQELTGHYLSELLRKSLDFYTTEATVASYP